MRYLVLLLALAMPAVAWLSNQGTFGPDNGEMSGRFPTLLVAADYAFAIWGLIFLLDVIWSGWQLKDRGDAIAKARLPAALGFGLSASWIPVFSQGWFLLALAIIWTSTFAMLAAAWFVSRDTQSAPRTRWLATAPLAMHAGWLSLAAFLNTAQVIVAYEWLDTRDMLGWSAVLIGLMGVFVLAGNRALRGHLAFVVAGLWGLAAVYVKQSQSSLAGADTAAWMAVALAVLLALQTAWLHWARRSPG